MKTGDTHERVGFGGPDRPANAAAVLVLAALVAFYLSILFIAGATAGRLVPSLDARLLGQVTVVVWGQGLESADAAAARAAEILAGQAGVQRVNVLDAEGSDAAIAELIAGRPLGGEQPRLVSVTGAPASLPPISNLRKLLNANRLTASLYDHRATPGPLKARTMVIAAVGIVLGVILCGCLFGVCFGAGVGATSPKTPRFELMTRLGADSAFIAARVARRSGMIGFVGGVAGTLCADLMLLASTLGHASWPSLGFVAFVQPQLLDGGWTAIWPILVTLVSATGAGLGAWRAIDRQERTL